MEIRKELQWFVQEMETQLKENDHKGGWKNCTDSYLLSRLLEEVSELLLVTLENDQLRIKEEAADVANFAMMIADNRYYENKEGV